MKRDPLLRSQDRARAPGFCLRQARSHAARAQENGLGHRWTPTDGTKGFALLKDGFEMPTTPTMDDIYDGRFLPPAQGSDVRLSAQVRGRGKTMGFVELDGVSLRYGEATARWRSSMSSLGIEPGEFAAVVGPSGCGKSSLMKLVTGLLPPSDGHRPRGRQRRSKGPLKIVGMAFQNPTLLPWRNTLSNTMLPLEIVQPHRWQLRSASAEYVELAQQAAGARSGSTASSRSSHGCCRAACSSARASAARSSISPELLMLDEPFAALDAFTREELWGVLQDLWLERKFTCILVTHDLREAAYPRRRHLRDERAAGPHRRDAPHRSAAAAHAST